MKDNNITQIKFEDWENSQKINPFEFDEIGQFDKNIPIKPLPDFEKTWAEIRRKSTKKKRKL